MEKKYKYVGCFVSQDLLFEKVNAFSGERLSKVIDEPHVTFSYRPAEVDETLFGTDIDVEVYAYGNDGVNEGVKVRLSTQNETLSSAIADISVPHITLSVSDEGKAVNTRLLEFAPIAPFPLAGVYGGYELREEGDGGTPGDG